jgi:hypothetical protein
VFGVSFLSNVSPFAGASYTLYSAFNLALIGFTPFNFGVIVAVSALGATIAKVVIYYGAFGLKKYIVGNKNVQLIGRNATRGDFFLILFFAALIPLLPLDDFIYIGAGATSASILAMSSVTFLAKVIKSGFEVAIELTLRSDLSAFLGFQRIDVTLLLTGVFVVIGVLVYKLDWQATFARLGSRAKFSGD